MTNPSYSRGSYLLSCPGGGRTSGTEGGPGRLGNWLHREGQRRGHLLGAPLADDHRHDRRAAQGELKGRRRQVRAVPLADVGELVGPGTNVLRRRAVIE